ncbi:MAG: metallopeptidase family protein [Thermomicrobiales bacterium]
MQQARRQRFERLVARALDDAPPALVAMLDNVVVTVEDEPLPHHLALWDDAPETLFGLYEGIPLTERDSHYGMVLPDRITIFRGPLERAFRSPQAIAREVRITVAHELGHHFGLDEDRLAALGLD